MSLEYPEYWVEDYGHPHMVCFPQNWVSDDPTERVYINVMAEYQIVDPEEDCFLLREADSDLLLLVNVPPGTFWDWLETQRDIVVQ